jgi:predicted Rossmann fold nucleotide-binding protein DprA/Smf involved in DNA uptake
VQGLINRVIERNSDLGGESIMGDVHETSEAAHISEDNPAYPAALNSCLGTAAPASIAAIGNGELLGRPKLALFCSIRCPGSLILRTYDLAQLLRQSDLVVVGGFHTPVERECLKVLLRGPEPVIVCPARAIDGMVIPAEWRRPLAEGRLLVVSGFAQSDQRVTLDTAQVRNRFVGALADGAFVAHAQPGGRTELLCRQMLAWKKPLYTFDDRVNANLLEMGARTTLPSMA